MQHFLFLLQHGLRNLKVKVKRARNLPDTAGWLNRPDPYVTVTGVKKANSGLQSTTLYSVQKKAVIHHRIKTYTLVVGIGNSYTLVFKMLTVEAMM